MKKITLTLTAILFMAISTFATVWTVSNDPAKPAQYSDLQTAIDAASPGDTILIGPSKLYLYNNSYYLTTYGTITLNYNLVLIGAGTHFTDGATTYTPSPINNTVTKVGTINLKQTSANSGASNTKIIGMQIAHINIQGGFTGSTITTGGIRGVLIEKCYISNASFSFVGYSAINSNDTIRNCIISNCIAFSNTSSGATIVKHVDISIENNIFDGAYINGSVDIASNSGNYLDSVYVRNNLFMDRTTYAFDKVPHMVIENNIFWKAEPNVTNTASGVTFNNNICYNTTNTLPGTGNIGSGNLNNTNPQFINYPSAGGAYSCSHDYSFPTTSPAHNAGTDASDIGITGGISPLYDFCSGPKVPTMKYITMPANASSVPQGGTLNVTFKAKNKD